MNQTSPTNPINPTKRVAIAIDLGPVVPWHYDCCEGILAYGREQGWSCTVDPFLLESASPDSHAYDGVVGRIDAGVAQAARDQGIPAVNHWMSSPVKDLPSVGIDKRSCGQMAGEHLVACGYRQLCLIDLDDVVGSPLVVEGLSHQGITPHFPDSLAFLCSAAYNLGNFLRRLALPPSVKHWTVRDKLIKIGAKMVQHARYVTFHLAEVAVPRRLYRTILQRIRRFAETMPRAAPI